MLLSLSANDNRYSRFWTSEARVLCNQYHSTLSALIDKHAPPHTKHVKAKYIPGWVNQGVIAAKETKCLFEHIWSRNRYPFNRSQKYRKFISTIESACKPNLNSLEQKFKKIITTLKNKMLSGES